MLKMRIIPVLLVKNIGLVKGVAFDSQRRIGSVLPAVNIYQLRDVDELVLLDIAATREGREPDYALIEEVATNCCVPLSVGGGLNSLDTIRKVLRAGADKVVVNTAAYGNHRLLEDTASQFGSQCLIGSIDVRRFDSSLMQCYSTLGTRCENVEADVWARTLEKRGVGEILLTSIDQDGTLAGYDFDLIGKVASNIGIPLIVAGGAGSYDHLLKAILVGANAVAAASMFHFTEQTPLGAKKFLESHGVAVRL